MLSVAIFSATTCQPFVIVFPNVLTAKIEIQSAVGVIFWKYIVMYYCENAYDDQIVYVSKLTLISEQSFGRVRLSASSKLVLEEFQKQATF